MSDENKHSQLNIAALRFVIAIGIVSFFADWAYEGARSSVTGPYLAILGASGALVGFIAGLFSNSQLPFRIRTTHTTGG